MDLIQALMSQYQGEMDMAMANIEIYRNNPAGIGEHPDVFEAMETEILEIAKYDDVLEMLDKYFS